MSEFEIGQKVTYEPHGRRGHGHEATITKIARKYVYATVHGRPQPFDKATGRAPGDFGGRIVTDEILAAESARTAAFDRVQPIRSGYGVWDRLTTDQINRIADIVEETAL